jgi:alpha/beta hydrolase fold
MSHERSETSAAQILRAFPSPTRLTAFSPAFALHQALSTADMSLISGVKAYLSNLFTMSKNLVVSPTSPPEEDETSSILTLPDGRKLGYAQYGSQAGRPVILLHGLAGSRFDAAFFHEVGQQLDARVIGVDRPGMGWSSPHPNRTLLDLGKDVEHLTEHLKLDDYSVMVRIPFPCGPIAN